MFTLYRTAFTNHTEYRFLITHENSDLGAISVKVMLHIVCYTTVFKCRHATLLPACVTTLKTAVWQTMLHGTIRHDGF